MELLLLVFFYIIIGFPFLLYFREFLNPNNPYLGLVYSSIYGFIYFNLGQLVLGFFGFAVVGDIALLFKILIAVIPFGIYLIRYRSLTFISNYFKSGQQSKLDKTDYLLLCIVLLLILSIYVIINQNYFLGYDEFRIWLVNAKEIYSTEFLRKDLTAMDKHRYYSSFLTIPIVNIYELYGGVFESKGRYITLIHIFFYLGVLLDRSKRLQAIERLFIVIASSTIVISFNNIFIKLLFINYIEVQLAFYIFFAVIVLFNETKSVDSLIKKVFLFAILIYIISFSKQGTLYFAVPIVFSFILFAYYDKKHTGLSELKFTDYIKKKDLIFCVLTLCILCTGHLKYDVVLKTADYNIENVFSELNSDSKVETYNNVTEGLIQKVKYPLQRIRTGFRNISLDRFFFLLREVGITYPGVLLLLLLFLTNSSFKLKNYLLIFIMLSAIALVFMGYLTSGKSIGNNSFHRYITHSFFCIPLIYLHTREKILKKPWLINLGSFSVLILYFFFIVNKNILSEINIKQGFHEGQLQYSDNFNKYTSAMVIKYKLSQIVGDQKVIFIDGNFSNGQNEEIYIQYLMQENSVAGELKGVKNYSNTNLINKIDHDFVVIFDFNNIDFDLINVSNEIDESAEVALFQKIDNETYTYLKIK